jgi:hypothetical protein
MSVPICASCTNPITRHSKTGRCRGCVLRDAKADPVREARRISALGAALRTPEARAAKSVARKRIEAERADDPAWIAYKIESGKRVRAAYDASPEAQAKNLATRATVGDKIRAKWLGWCPPERWAEYQALRRKVGAEEARRAIEAEIVGTTEHARRVVANNAFAMQLRHERELAQRY